MADDGKPMTDEERRAFWEELERENLAKIAPFERYLYSNGLFDDVIRPEITADDVVQRTAGPLHRSRLRRMYRLLEGTGSKRRLPIAPMHATSFPE